jgi:DivIVA domain-containing protein
LFWFMLIALVAVVASVALAVLGDGGGLRDVEPDRLEDRLPDERPVGRCDIDQLRLPVVVRGYRMADVDDVLNRLGAELTERDARITELEAERAGERAVALAKETRPEGCQGSHQQPRPEDQPHEG